MAIIIRTAFPDLLLSKVRNAIVYAEIKDWLKHEKKDLFTYALGPHASKAWFLSRIYPGELRFGIIFPARCVRKKEYYAIYHGKMVGMLLSYFQEDMEHIGVTAGKTEPDVGRKTGTA